jgi:hypothetical protein
MDSATIDQIIDAAQSLPPEQQGRFIARRAIEISRLADAAIAPCAVRIEYQTWCRLCGIADDYSPRAVAFALHILGRSNGIRQEAPF